MSAKDGIAEPGSLLDEINQFGALLGKPPIQLKPITAEVAKMKRRPNLLAQIEVEIVLGETRHPVTIDVYGKIVEAEHESLSGRATVEQYPRRVEDMTCEINGEPADLILPESLLEQIANEIIEGDHE